MVETIQEVLDWIIAHEKGPPCNNSCVISVPKRKSDSKRDRLLVDDVRVSFTWKNLVLLSWLNDYADSQQQFIIKKSLYKLFAKYTTFVIFARKRILNEF